MRYPIDEKKEWHEIHLEELREVEEVVPMTTPDRNRLRRWVYTGHSTDTNPWNYLDEDGEQMSFIEALYRHRKEMWGQYYEPFYIVTKNF